MITRLYGNLGGHECHADVEAHTVFVCVCHETQQDHDEDGRCEKVTQAGPCDCPGFVLAYTQQRFSGLLRLPSQEPSECRDSQPRQSGGPA